MKWITRLDRYGRVPRLSLDLFAGRPAGLDEEPGEGEVLITLPADPIAPGYALVLDGDEANVVEDHIGEIHYSAATGARVEIAALGSLPAGLIATPPPPTSSLASLAWVGGQWQVSEPIAPLRAAALIKAISAADQITGRVTRRYPAAEVTSWPTQDREARAVLAGATATEAPLVAALAVAAGVTLTAYAQSIITKSDAYRAILVAVKGLRETAQTAIADADTPAEVETALADILADADVLIVSLGLAD
jgi:hypothetical protein